MCSTCWMPGSRQCCVPTDGHPAIGTPLLGFMTRHDSSLYQTGSTAPREAAIQRWEHTTRHRGRDPNLAGHSGTEAPENWSGHLETLVCFRGREVEHPHQRPPLSHNDLRSRWLHLRFVIQPFNTHCSDPCMPGHMAWQAVLLQAQ